MHTIKTGIIDHVEELRWNQIWEDLNSASKNHKQKRWITFSQQVTFDDGAGTEKVQISKQRLRNKLEIYLMILLLTRRRLPAMLDMKAWIKKSSELPSCDNGKVCARIKILMIRKWDQWIVSSNNKVFFGIQINRGNLGNCKWEISIKLWLMQLTSVNIHTHTHQHNNHSACDLHRNYYPIIDCWWLLMQPRIEIILMLTKNHWQTSIRVEVLKSTRSQVSERTKINSSPARCFMAFRKKKINFNSL